jgi:hypothetical protein
MKSPVTLVREQECPLFSPGIRRQRRDALIRRGAIDSARYPSYLRVSNIDAR